MGLVASYYCPAKDCSWQSEHIRLGRGIATGPWGYGPGFCRECQDVTQAKGLLKEERAKLLDKSLNLLCEVCESPCERWEGKCPLCGEEARSLRVGIWD